MKDKILQVLREADDFISGQEICNRFSVSRTAVWKAIKQLRDEGYSIEAVNNKGYRLEETPDVISALELGSLLHTQWFGKEILYFDSIDSTNNELKRQAEKGVKLLRVRSMGRLQMDRCTEYSTTRGVIILLTVRR